MFQFTISKVADTNVSSDEGFGHGLTDEDK